MPRDFGQIATHRGAALSQIEERREEFEKNLSRSRKYIDGSLIDLDNLCRKLGISQDDAYTVHEAVDTLLLHREVYEAQFAIHQTLYGPEASDD